MDFIENNTLFLSAVILLGLIIGSFLNVVIYRLPIMLENSWRRECEEFLGLTHSPASPPARYDLIVPRSQCPQCGHLIRAHENIPVISYLLLGGKCAHCKAPIALRYPLIEMLTALVSAIVAWKLGPSWQTGFGLLLSWALIALSVIDIDRQLLPDSVTQPLLWLGLFLSLFGVFTDKESSIIGAIAGYLSLWSVFHLFKLLTGKDGMGYGDFKLLALFGAWLGWKSLLLIVLLSSLIGAVTGGLMILLLKHDRSIPIPFGPYLAAAGWVALLWGREISDAYLSFAGIS
ncbi:MAG: A24 family peptidase [Methylococcaceae bacterium]|nr:A24 family peptidase [Methylococcaceae bacterium]